MNTHHVIILYGGDWLQREKCGDDKYSQPPGSHAISAVELPINFTTKQLTKEVATLLGISEMTAVEISCIVYEEATKLKRRLQILNEETLRFYMLNAQQPTFFIPSLNKITYVEDILAPGFASQCFID